jgi:hypothetical protein
MSKFEKQLAKIGRLQAEVIAVEKILTDIIEAHLGDGWFLTYDRGDGFLLADDDANNYQISTYLETQSMSRDEAIEYILDHPFN